MISIKILILALNLFVNHYHYDSEIPFIEQFSTNVTYASCVYTPKEFKHNSVTCSTAAFNLCHYSSDDDVFDDTGINLDCKALLNEAYKEY